MYQEILTFRNFHFDYFNRGSIISIKYIYLFVILDLKDCIKNVKHLNLDKTLKSSNWLVVSLEGPTSTKDKYKITLIIYMKISNTSINIEYKNTKEWSMMPSYSFQNSVIISTPKKKSKFFVEIFKYLFQSVQAATLVRPSVDLCVLRKVSTIRWLNLAPVSFHRSGRERKPGNRTRKEIDRRYIIWWILLVIFSM